ncbi:hypothetical protein Ocin01_04380 [Orchesella cincta]|uniref:Uncharacterized protein n=1 Tax=Orchesella cincta TaxID=48709 RepID=A0A1D2NB55_ORCCI|nr:hypothetical protein Ocin01_04380 [Orchesella cincta]
MVTADQSTSTVVSSNEHHHMSHYSSASVCSYYQSAVTTTKGMPTSVPYLDYNNHSHGMSAAAAAAAQYAQHAQQQHRVATAAVASASSFRATPHHHHAKVINPTQAVAYQQAYHQYQQYMHHHGMVHSHQHHPHPQNAPVVHQRMIGMPIMTNGAATVTQPHQQPRLVPFVNRTGPPMQQPQHLHHHHHHGYSNAQMMPTASYPHHHHQPVQQTQMDATAQLPNFVDASNNCSSKPCLASQPTKPVENGKSQYPSVPYVPNVFKGTVKDVNSKSRPDKPAKVRRTKASRDQQVEIGQGSKSEPRVKDQGSQFPEDFTPVVYTDQCDCARQQAWSYPVTSCNCPRMAINPAKPPPGFEHLMQSTFPIEQYDPSILGNLMRAQLCHEAMSFDGIPVCCEGVPLASLDEESDEEFLEIQVNADELQQDDVKEWSMLHSAIRQSLDDWTEELQTRQKIKEVLCKVDLQTIFVKNCDSSSSEEIVSEEESSDSSDALSELEHVLCPLPFNEIPVQVQAA